MIVTLKQCNAHTIWMLYCKRGGMGASPWLPGGERSEPRQEFPGAGCDNLSHAT